MIMNKIKFAIIDDETFAHESLINLMIIHDNFVCTGQYYSVMEAINGLKINKPDFIFLDVEMPNLNGFELLNYIDKSIYIVITSSHKTYAYDGFEHEVFDFLWKPIQQDKLFKTLYKLSDLFTINMESENVSNANINLDNSILYVSKLRDKSIVKLQVKEICCINKNGNDLEVTTINNSKYYRKDSIYNIINELPQNYFKIINRSCIVNLSKIYWVDKSTVRLPNGEVLKVTEKFK